MDVFIIGRFERDILLMPKEIAKRHFSLPTTTKIVDSTDTNSLKPAEKSTSSIKENNEYVIKYPCCEKIQYKSSLFGKFPKHTFLEDGVQREISPILRMCIIDKIFLKYKQLRMKRQETIFLAINIVDRFLELKEVSSKKLYTIAITALWIAEKYCEIANNNLEQFTKYSFISNEDCVDMEFLVLSTLEWNLLIITPNYFTEIYKENNEKSNKKLDLKLKEKLSFYIDFILEITLTNVYSYKYNPFELAFATIKLSNELLLLNDLDLKTIEKQMVCIRFKECTNHRHPYILEVEKQEEMRKECFYWLKKEVMLFLKGDNVLELKSRYILRNKETYDEMKILIFGY